MDAQRTTQLENGTHRLFPLPPPTLARYPPAQQQGGAYFHLSSLDIITFLLLWMLSSPEDGGCQRWVADLGLLWDVASMGLRCPGLGCYLGFAPCPKGGRVRDHVLGTLSPPPPAPWGKKSPLFPAK